MGSVTGDAGRVAHTARLAMVHSGGGLAKFYALLVLFWTTSLSTMFLLWGVYTLNVSAWLQPLGSFEFAATQTPHLLSAYGVSAIGVAVFFKMYLTPAQLLLLTFYKALPLRGLALYLIFFYIPFMGLVLPAFFIGFGWLAKPVLFLPFGF
jgi:hypothetical protein